MVDDKSRTTKEKELEAEGEKENEGGKNKWRRGRKKEAFGGDYIERVLFCVKGFFFKKILV